MTCILYHVIYQLNGRFIHSNIEIASLTKSVSTFHGLTSTGTIFSDKYSLHNTHIVHCSLLASTACASGIFAYCNVGHHFKLTFHMHIAQFKTINQV